MFTTSYVAIVISQNIEKLKQIMEYGTSWISNKPSDVIIRLSASLVPVFCLSVHLVCLSLLCVA